MAFFKFRKGADAPTPSPPESIESLRRRARYRLTGAAVLVLAGVIGFPLLFDTQPRPVAVDIPIDIPDRNKVKPLGAPAPAAAVRAPAIADPVASAASETPASAQPALAPASSATAAPTPALTPTPKAIAEAGGPTATEARAEAKPAAVPEPKAEAKPETRSEAKAAPKTEAKPEVKAVKAPSDAEVEAAKARSLLEGKPVEAVAAAAGDARYVVQIGAFADPAKAQDTRQRVEKAGLKTYTHVAETKEGKRTRVRVGPFATRGEADKAAARIKGLDLPAAVLTL